RIDADLGRGGNQPFHLVDDGFHGVAGELYAQSTGKGILVQADIDGDGQADFTVFCNGVTALLETDFIL
ncbi:MAG: calcium-binding protein, partial [bacterium]